MASPEMSHEAREDLLVKAHETADKIDAASRENDKIDRKFLEDLALNGDEDQLALLREFTAIQGEHMEGEWVPRVEEIAIIEEVENLTAQYQSGSYEVVADDSESPVIYDEQADMQYEDGELTVDELMGRSTGVAAPTEPKPSNETPAKEDAELGSLDLDGDGRIDFTQPKPTLLDQNADGLYDMYQPEISGDEDGDGIADPVDRFSNVPPQAETPEDMDKDNSGYPDFLEEDAFGKRRAEVTNMISDALAKVESGSDEFNRIMEIDKRNDALEVGDFDGLAAVKADLLEATADYLAPQVAAIPAEMAEKDSWTKEEALPYLRMTAEAQENPDNGRILPPEGHLWAEPDSKDNWKVVPRTYDGAASEALPVTPAAQAPEAPEAPEPVVPAVGETPQAPDVVAAGPAANTRESFMGRRGDLISGSNGEFTIDLETKNDVQWSKFADFNDFFLEGKDPKDLVVKVGETSYEWDGTNWAGGRDGYLKLYSEPVSFTVEAKAVAPVEPATPEVKPTEPAAPEAPVDEIKAPEKAEEVIEWAGSNKRTTTILGNLFSGGLDSDAGRHTDHDALLRQLRGKYQNGVDFHISGLSLMDGKLTLKLTVRNEDGSITEHGNTIDTMSAQGEEGENLALDLRDMSGPEIQTALNKDVHKPAVRKMYLWLLGDHNQGEVVEPSKAAIEAVEATDGEAPVGVEAAEAPAAAGPQSLRWAKRQTVFDEIRALSIPTEEGWQQYEKKPGNHEYRQYGEKDGEGVIRVTRRQVKLEGSDQWYDVPYIPFLEQEIAKKYKDSDAYTPDKSTPEGKAVWANRFKSYPTAPLVLTPVQGE